MSIENSVYYVDFRMKINKLANRLILIYQVTDILLTNFSVYGNSTGTRLKIQFSFQYLFDIDFY